MSFERGIDESAGEPVSGRAAIQEKRRAARSAVVATGTLACPACDAPVALFAPLAPAAPATCPVCQHAARVRDFLTLGEPTRPARVEVRVVARANQTVGRLPTS